MSPVVVAYHWPCPDGAYGAIAALYGIPPSFDITFVPLAIYWSFDKQWAALAAALQAGGASLYMIDYSGGPALLLAACRAATAVYLLDHHKTAAEDIAAMGKTIPANLMPTLDMTRSGASIARDHFDLTATLPTRLGDAAAD